MEKIKPLIISLLLIHALLIEAQDKSFVIKGLISGRLTLSPSLSFSNNNSAFYLHGNLEHYVSENISLVGEGYYYLGELSSAENIFSFNHSLFFGASKHFTKGKNDWYIGFQPGLSFTKLNNVYTLSPTQIGANPLASFVTGYNFYMGSIFHYFVQARYVAGSHHYDVYKGLSELRLSAGLGFNLWANKK